MEKERYFDIKSDPCYRKIKRRLLDELDNLSSYSNFFVNNIYLKKRAMLSLVVDSLDYIDTNLNLKINSALLYDLDDKTKKSNSIKDSIRGGRPKRRIPKEQIEKSDETMDEYNTLYKINEDVMEELKNLADNMPFIELLSSHEMYSGFMYYTDYIKKLEEKLVKDPEFKELSKTYKDD